MKLHIYYQKGSSFLSFRNKVQPTSDLEDPVPATDPVLAPDSVPTPVNPSKSINGIGFTLSGKIIDEEGRVMIFITSINRQQVHRRFFVYRSNSDAFFRLCIQKPGSVAYEKGNHYISTTFIHWELQEFILDNLDSLETLDSYDCTDVYRQNFYDVENLLTHPFEQDTVFNVIRDILPIGQDQSNMFFRKFSYEEIELRIFAVKQVLISSLILEKDTLTHIRNFEYTFQNVTVKINLFCIHCRTRAWSSSKREYTFKRYKLFFSRTTIIMHERRKQKRCYNIVNLESENNSITPFGTYSKICNPGAYIYKVMDYEHQVNIDLGLPSIVPTEYKYVGELINYFYPLDDLSKWAKEKYGDLP